MPMQPLIRFLAASLICLLPGTAFALEKIRIANSEWEPYSTEADPEGGFATEIVRTALARAGFEIEMYWATWARVTLDVREGRADATFNMYHSPERAERLDFSEPYSLVEVVFFARRDHDIPYRRLEDLAPYRIGVVKGAIHSPAFEAADYLNKETVSSLRSNLKKLLLGRLDLVVENRLVAIRALKDMAGSPLDRLQILSPPLSSQALHFAASKTYNGQTRVIDRFNRELVRMRKNDVISAILKRHNLSG